MSATAIIYHPPSSLHNRLARLGATGEMSSLEYVAYASAKDERDLIDAESFFNCDSSARRPLPRFPEPCTNKVHWEHLLEEMSWLSKDFVRERKWR